MNDEEIMKKFNEKFSDDNPTSTSVEKEFGDVAPYKASENNNNNNINTSQPTSDNHPQMSVNSLLEKDNRTYYNNDNNVNPNSGSNYNSNGLEIFILYICIHNFPVSLQYFCYHLHR